MGVQKPTRHTRRLKQIPSRQERIHEGTPEHLNRRAEVARSSRIPREPRASKDVDNPRLRQARVGYTGYEVRGTGPSGADRKPLGREHRPGMAAIRVSQEVMTHKDSKRNRAQRIPKKKMG